MIIKLDMKVVLIKFIEKNVIFYVHILICYYKLFRIFFNF